MREIKFRAWDMPFGSKGPMQEMIYSNASTILAFAEMSPDKYVVEQYTGLKDVNGKPIYEGDILKVTADDGDFYLAPVKYGIDQDYPAFDLDGKYVSNHWYYESNRLSSIAYGDGSTMSIVGNIHENKDLLEGGK